MKRVIKNKYKRRREQNRTSTPVLSTSDDVIKHGIAGQPMARTNHPFYDTEFNFLIHQHEYVTLLRTESSKRLNLVIVFSSFLFIMFASETGYAYENNLLFGAVLWLAILVIINISIIGIFAFRLLLPITVDAESVMIPDAIFTKFSSKEHYDSFIREQDVNSLISIITQEIYAVALAEDVRKQSLKYIIYFMASLYFLLLTYSVAILLAKRAWQI